MSRVHKRVGEGFALAMVLVIMVAGMALLGAAFYLHGSFVHRATRSMGDVEIDNHMDEGIEFGTTELMSRISLQGGGFLFRDPTFNGNIQKPEDLVVVDGATKMIYEKKGLTAADGKKYDFRVDILDLYYTEDNLAPSITEEQRAKLPPMVNDVGSSYHTYLIRSAMFKTPPESGGMVTETAVTVNREWISSDDISGEIH